jgi:hypothetical protein
MVDLSDRLPDKTRRHLIALLDVNVLVALLSQAPLTLIRK